MGAGHSEFGGKPVVKPFSARAMVITDLDGTLLGSDGSLTKRDRDALLAWGKAALSG